MDIGLIIICVMLYVTQIFEVIAFRDSFETKVGFLVLLIPSTLYIYMVYNILKDIVLYVIRNWRTLK